MTEHHVATAFAATAAWPDDAVYEDVACMLHDLMHCWDLPPRAVVFMEAACHELEGTGAETWLDRGLRSDPWQCGES